ncbi:MAG: HAD family hydrolase [Candidatus Rokubacteria bacterium]|nr:HAD family hydrolase [Candidatus Rokubacteria bacterium]
MIAAVTFDFWETLVHDTPENLERGRALRLEALGALLARAGAPQPAAALDDAYERSGTAMRERFWARQRDASIGEQVRLFLDCVGPGLAERLGPAGLAEAVEAYAAPVLRLPPLLNPGAREAVRELAGRGVRLGIVSNTGRTPGVVLRRVLERYGLLRHFAAISYSDEVGFRKPHAAIFELTLRALGARPADAVHVGDNPLDDVEGARSFGMRAAHYAAGGRPAAAAADVIVTDLAELPLRLV